MFSRVRRACGELLGIPVAVGCGRGCERAVRTPSALQSALRAFAALTDFRLSAHFAHPGGAPPSPRCLRLGVQGSLPDSTPAVCGFPPMHTQAQSTSREAMRGARLGWLSTHLDAAIVGASCPLGQSVEVGSHGVAKLITTWKGDGHGQV